MSSVPVLLTDVAADVAKTLTPDARRAVGRFLHDELDDYVKTHEPTRISGLAGKYWVIRPNSAPDSPTLVVTERAGDEDGSYVVTAMIPEEAVAAVAKAQAVQAESASAHDVAVGADVVRKSLSRS